MNPQHRLVLEELSVGEKVELMEALWEDMLQRSDSLPSLSWHKQILDERRQSVLSGEARYSSLDEVEKRLMNRLS
ncbi:MAG TPA: addiction module protein [Pyrinomonadaceae bacterium]|nr:addiction module protein [Pyrinomonadaceae bacterium]